MIYQTEAGSHISLAHLVRVEPPRAVDNFISIFVHLQGVNGQQTVFNVKTDGKNAEDAEKVMKHAKKKHEDLLAAWADFYKKK